MPIRIISEWTRPVGRAMRPVGGPLPWEIAHHGVVGNIEESKPRLYLAKKVVDTMTRRSREGAIRRREDMGLLLGDWALDADDDPYAVAMDLLTGPLDASPVAVKFKLEGLMRWPKTWMTWSTRTSSWDGTTPTWTWDASSLTRTKKHRRVVSPIPTRWRSLSTP